MTNKEVQDCIIYQNASFIIANKPGGLPTQKDVSEDKSFHEILQDFVGVGLFLIHRLDRPTSGAIVFAKKKRAAAYYSSLLNEKRIDKTYLAAVKNPPPKPEGEISHYLLHDTKMKKSFVSTASNKIAKLAELEYKTIGKTENYTLLEVTLKSGRFHQIRAQLAAIGSPIKGDVKYGARRANKDRSIHLHANSISFPLQYNDESITCRAAVPDDAIWQVLAKENHSLLKNNHKLWKNKV